MKLYSALGQPLLAEVTLLPSERTAQSFRVEGAGRSWSSVPVKTQGTLLILSDKAVEQPVLELTLQAGELSRPLVLLLHPVPPHSRSDYLQSLLQDYNRLGEAQAASLSQPSSPPQQTTYWWQLPQGEVASRWLLFLLLGGGFSWGVLRWWRKAETVDLNMPAAVERVDQQLNRFQQDVEHVEGLIKATRVEQRPQ